MTRFSISLTLIAAVGLVASACDAGVATGESCTLTQNLDGSTLMTCPDGTSTTIPDGTSTATAPSATPTCTVSERDDGMFVMSCPDGSEAVFGSGNAGANGIDGEGCTVTPIDDASSLIECANGTEVVVSNGVDGAAGNDGNDGNHGNDGNDGNDGVDGVDGQSCTIVQEDGETKLVCPDGSEWTLSGEGDDTNTEPEPPLVQPEEELILVGSITPDEQAQIDVLRSAIEAGLSLGSNSYLDQVSLNLQQQGVVNNYEANFSEDYSLTEEEVDACPFVKNLSNTVPTSFACDYLVEVAKTEVNGDIVALLDENPLPGDVVDADESGSAGFWYEQGAISGIEQRTVLVRSDLKTSLVCNVDESGAYNPTADESSYEKGLVVGAQAMADAFNDWLAEQGHTADYPTMSQPIEVCNINGGALDPAHQDAKSKISDTMDDEPLCSNWEPTNTQQALQYAESQMQYEAGIEAGIEAEYSLAAVRIFKVVPCNVGDPLVVDLDGDGIELRPIHQGVNFDFYGVGSKQATAWVSSDDALLAMDRDHDGAITTGLELFGNVDRAFADGFTHLAEMDSNADGVIDAADPGYAELVLWRDNGDGVSQADELLSLTEVGLTAIPLNAGDVSMRSGGSRIPKAVQAGAFLVGDAYFTTAPYASPRF